MLVVEMEKPKNCMYCYLRLVCNVYGKWLKDKTSIVSPKPMCSAGCLIKGEVKCQLEK